MKGKISILGAGAFGTSIATILANNDYEVSLWAYEESVVNQINFEHENKTYFAGFKLSENITATTSLQESTKDSNILFIAIPVKYLRTILEKTKEFIIPDQIMVSLSKGIEGSTFLFPTQIIQDLLNINKDNILVLAGPNFAHEIAEKRQTYSVIAGNNKDVANTVKNALENDFFKTEVSGDIIGVQVGAALKNIISLLAGLISGLDLGQNYLAYLVSKSFQEVATFSKELGGQPETIYGISGFGDLYLSSTNSIGRNYSIGLEIGKLIKENNFNKDLFFKDKILPEGINTLVSLHNYVIKHKLDLKFLSLAYDIIFEGKWER